jgi:hypothetical protein
MPYKCPEISQLIYERNLLEVFPDFAVFLKIYVPLPVTSCEGEKTFLNYQ